MRNKKLAWCPPPSLVDHFENILRRFEATLDVAEPSWAISRPSRRHLVPSWEHPRGVLGHLGPLVIQEPFCNTLRHLGDILEVLKGFKLILNDVLTFFTCSENHLAPLSSLGEETLLVRGQNKCYLGTKNAFKTHLKNFNKSPNTFSTFVEIVLKVF